MESLISLTVGVAASSPPLVRRASNALRAYGVTELIGASSWDELNDRCRRKQSVLGAVALGSDRPTDVRSARTAMEGVALVVIVGEMAPARARGLLAAGADGLVVEDHLEDSLGPSIEAALAGQLVLPRELGRVVVAPSLSTREKQVLGMVALGLSNFEIAAQLFVAESTVKTHLFSAFKKLGVRSRSEAATLIADPSSGVGAGILTIPGG